MRCEPVSEHKETTPKIGVARLRVRNVGRGLPTSLEANAHRKFSIADVKSCQTRNAITCATTWTASDVFPGERARWRGTGALLIRTVLTYQIENIEIRSVAKAKNHDMRYRLKL